MTASADQRRLLGAFIRSHREHLDAPSRPGGPNAAPGRRRRTAGLRREEVALLCGISVTWYTWIEQGRDISISPASLARLADALRLTAAERAYAFELAQKRDPVPPFATVARPGDGVPASLAAALEAVTTPAYLLDRNWRAVAWNEAAAELFTDWLGGPESNLLRYVFLDPNARRFIRDWDDRARRLLAEFRADTALAPNDPAQLALVTGLREASPVFARLWDEHAVLAREGGARAFEHPKDGIRLYQQVTLAPAAHPDHKFVMLLPDRAPSAEC